MHESCIVGSCIMNSHNPENTANKSTESIKGHQFDSPELGTLSSPSSNNSLLVKIIYG